ncbi:hypothetical protein B586_20170 [Mycobacterium haemophilum DSM 44634]|nr:hypothetical protein B586_20170 [Mycobacterium haemophilum DSM 44634]MCV7342136.1 hypothetical protein [Mycobacterium haemophilum DSM 44634]
MAEHEIADAGAVVLLVTRHHVDQHQLDNFEGVVGVWRTVAVTVSTRVDRDDVVTLVREDLAGGFPRKRCWPPPCNIRTVGATTIRQ